MPNSVRDSSEAVREDQEALDVIVVGAGFSGIYLLYRLRALGLSCKVLEAADGVGGTWYWNRYPGARCDVESMTYSYSFSDELQQDWTWSARYAPQPEILDYINHVTDRFALRPDIEFETRVVKASFDEQRDRWNIETESGKVWRATHFVMATGCLSTPKLPAFDGLDDFEGDWYHTGQWPHQEVDFTGKSVGIIGTGSTGIQSIPYIAAQASHLTVFQRTPNFSIPAWNDRLSDEAIAKWKKNYRALREQARHTPSGDIYEVNMTSALAVTGEEREQVFSRRWGQGAFNLQAAFFDLTLDERANEFAAEFVRNKIRSRVHDPDVAELLCPKDHPFGTKRLCVDTDYYETYNRDNVTLVDIKHSPIERITRKGLRTGGIDYEFDAIIFATGFDAMTGAVLDVDIRGIDGESLRERWSMGPRTYLGLSVSGFPNFFTITGPGSPSVLSNMMFAIEQHVEWVADCIDHLKKNQLSRIEATREAEDEWVEHVSEVANRTLFPKANSWYMGSNIPGKPRVFAPYVGGMAVYTQTCDEVVRQGYRGFNLSG